jgi:hypothetical protein
MGIAICWVVVKPGITRNIIIAGGTAGLVILLWGIRNVNRVSLEKPELSEKNPEKKPEKNTDPFSSLENCLRYYRIANHPSAISLEQRVDEYRELVIEMAKERSGKGRWKSRNENPKLRACLCGELTRDEVIRSLDLKIEEIPEETGAGLGIPLIIGGKPIAEDGKPATRVLKDPVVEKAVEDLLYHRPEAKDALLAVKERYVENIIRRLIGPLDGKGQSIVPLCRWRKRFDGKYYDDFERLEKVFAGQ